MSRFLYVSVFLGSCVACAGGRQLPPRLQIHNVERLVEVLDAARSPVDSFVGEARLTYFGPEGRVKSTATLAVARPGSMRYELRGPHGGVIEAFATNGQELQLLDMKNSRFLYGPATVDNFNRLMAFAPLHLDARGWVGMLFGEVPVPPGASIQWDGHRERYLVGWTLGARRVEIAVDPKTRQITNATAHEQGAVVSVVHIAARDERGLPTELRIRAPAADVDLRIKLRDVAYDPGLGSDVFTLDPPPSMVPERLGS